MDRIDERSSFGAFRLLSADNSYHVGQNQDRNENDEIDRVGGLRLGETMTDTHEMPRKHFQRKGHPRQEAGEGMTLEIGGFELHFFRISQRAAGG